MFELDDFDSLDCFDPDRMLRVDFDCMASSSACSYVMLKPVTLLLLGCECESDEAEAADADSHPHATEEEDSAWLCLLAAYTRSVEIVPRDCFFGLRTGTLLLF